MESSHYYFNMFGKAYNLDDLMERLRLRLDLFKIGFFNKENDKYYSWFEEDKIGKSRVLEILNAIKLFIKSTFFRNFRNTNEIN